MFSVIFPTRRSAVQGGGDDDDVAVVTLADGVDGEPGVSDQLAPVRRRRGVLVVWIRKRENADPTAESADATSVCECVAGGSRREVVK